MTIEKLREVANAAMKELKRELLKHGNTPPYFQAISADGRREKFDMPPGFEKLLNVGDAKEAIFDWFRQRTARYGVAAWIFGTDAWASRQTEEGRKHTLEETRKHTDFGFKKLEAMGWVTVHEAILVTAQTESDVLLLKQPYVRDSESEIRFVGPPQEQAMKQHEFGGRQKMFGATADDIAGYARKRTM